MFLLGWLPQMEAHRKQATPSGNWFFLKFQSTSCSTNMVQVTS